MWIKDNHLKYTKTAIEKSGNEYQKFKQIQKKKEKEGSLNELENDIENLGKKLWFFLWFIKISIAFAIV